jgi:hypothetical protein
MEADVQIQTVFDIVLTCGCKLANMVVPGLQVTEKTTTYCAVHDAEVKVRQIEAKEYDDGCTE